MSISTGGEGVFAAIDLKSFYASVECISRGLDPLTTNLVVADTSRTEKTICLAVSPSLKAYGISGRARLFEVIQRIGEVNAQRRRSSPHGRLFGKSVSAPELAANPSLEIDYLAAPPRMALYLEYSTKIYGVYLKYVAPEDIHVYSIDEVFLDITSYLRVQKISAREFVRRIIKDVLDTTGITATAGIGTNLYLCKVAMDIVAKHVPADSDGVRIAELDERTYREQLWTHRPLTDFWRVGRGYAEKLEANGMYTMGDVARCSLGGDGERMNEELLYKLFGVNAELLIDHAWGYEPCTMRAIKEYKPEASSTSVGQVLHCPYDYEGVRLIVREMADQLSLDLVGRSLMTDRITLTVGYDVDNLAKDGTRVKYSGEVTVDYYGRRVPKHAHGTTALGRHTSSTRIIVDESLALLERIINKELLVRRVNVTAGNLLEESEARSGGVEQLDLFTDVEAYERAEAQRKEELEREHRMQRAVLDIKSKFGKNAIVKGMNLEEGATGRQRNEQIGGHKA